MLFPQPHLDSSSEHSQDSQERVPTHWTLSPSEFSPSRVNDAQLALFLAKDIASFIPNYYDRHITRPCVLTSVRREWLLSLIELMRLLNTKPKILKVLAPKFVATLKARLDRLSADELHRLSADELDLSDLTLQAWAVFMQSLPDDALHDEGFLSQAVATLVPCLSTHQERVIQILHYLFVDKRYLHILVDALCLLLEIIK